MSRFTSIIVLCAIVALALAATQPKPADKKAPKTAEEKEIKKVVKQIMTSPDGTPKTKSEVKKIVKQLEKEKEKARRGIFHHVYRHAEEAENIDVEERNADKAVKMKSSNGNLFQIKHLLNEKDNAEEGELKPLDPETLDLQKKYEKILKTVLKENKKTDKKQSTMGLIKEVDKRMRLKQRNHPIKTSDRMIAYMKELLRQLNGGTLEGANQYDMKGFVSSVFGRYRARHEAEKERKRRILALKEHMAREQPYMRHHPNFYDEFYTPYENGYDTKFNLRPLAPHHYPDESPVLQTSILPHPESLSLTDADRQHYLGDQTFNQEMTMPYVTPDTRLADLLDSLNINTDKLKTSSDNKGFWQRIKDWLHDTFN